jgi:heme A synthase
MNTVPAGAAHVAARGEPASRARFQVAAWLLACCALVYAMVVVGGVTRLTHSGLSIVEWQPIVGAVPPLSEAQWMKTFGEYQLTPEYQKVNQGMSLAAFKSIFWWEYFHRLLGRTIGFVFLLPLLWFWRRGYIDRPLVLKLAGIFVLGGLQGAMGWYMVKSGLVDDPRSRRIWRSPSRSMPRCCGPRWICFTPARKRGNLGCADSPGSSPRWSPTWW